MEFNNNKEDLRTKLKLNSKLMPKKYSIKFLGVIVESNLKWSTHVKSLLSKISINKNLRGKSHKVLNTQSKKSIYYAHIYVTCDIQFSYFSVTTRPKMRCLG